MNIVMPTSNSQRELLAQAKNGDTGAFGRLLEQCRAELKKYISARIGIHLRSKLAPEDVYQETCTRAWESIEGLKWTGADTFIRWLKGISRHVILRQAGRREHGDLIYVDQDPGSQEPSPSRTLRREERFDRLQEAVDRLPEEYRQAVVLIRIEGLQIKDAAERMNRTPKAVMHLVSRGLKKLKESLADTGSLRLPPRRLSGGRPDER